ncbi:aldehyde dehydrogenase (NADP(+)) [Maribrevibacterium harenarium]|uniref:2,5-dioxovalerate dehydrogenase n=1 Tax=Maribrevibacterium harenarium TaxID=2589817 RepID=A0A501WP04_9GAMM|nr:aldehyde dehydrogenase (NADP(+)) [Maribrevibacterium harenarium]TPE49017.1 aldehyde dehydrogenase (NADP(+)) [Maribrevibacterium harenarium]
MEASQLLKGTLLIAGQDVLGTQAAIHAINPATNETMEPAYLGGTQAQVDHAAQAAWQAFDAYRGTAPEARAQFLETIADEILALGDTLVHRVMAESGLPQARVEGERGRTMGQLRLFASVVRAGKYLDVRIDPALPERTPLPRNDLRLQYIPLGPVAVFGASNFPLAFSVAGGDTASALAAGCPVIVKAHSAHPGTSELVGRAITAAAQKTGMPAGVFSLMYGSGREVGSALVAHPHIKAVGFTGSRAGGVALMNIAAARKEPIPVYAEMSSINPVFLMPNKLATQAEAVAKGFVGSLMMGAGQFCTNPGLVVTCDGEGADTFINTVTAEIQAQGTQTMLTPGIHKAYCEGVAKLAANTGVELVGKGNASDAPNQCQAHVFKTSAAAFLADPSMEDEVFGSTSLIIQCQNLDEYKAVAEHLEGQLTATIQLTDEDVAAVRSLLPILERKAGRILCNAFPTGVEVCHAMVHGGPFPATSDARTTSVGSAAIDRFVRPVCYQDLPVALQPAAIQDANPLNVPQLVDGRLS